MGKTSSKRTDKALLEWLHGVEQQSSDYLEDKAMEIIRKAALEAFEAKDSSLLKSTKDLRRLLHISEVRAYKLTWGLDKAGKIKRVKLGPVYRMVPCGLDMEATDGC